MTSLDNARYRTINRNKKPVKQIALETGIREGTLYAYGLPLETTGGRDIPLSKLVPLMKATNCYDILRVISQACGFLMVRVPRAAQNKQDDNRLVNDYQRLCSECVAELIRFLEHPTKTNCINTHNLLQDVMAASAGIQKRVKSHFQTELDI